MSVWPRAQIQNAKRTKKIRGDVSVKLYVMHPAPRNVSFRTFESSLCIPQNDPHFDYNYSASCLKKSFQNYEIFIFDDFFSTSQNLFKSYFGKWIVVEISNLIKKRLEFFPL